MSDQAAPASTYQKRPQSLVDRDLARVLALLEDDQAGGLTIADFGERGVQAPAQAVYMLQLAGYDIDRVHREHPHRHRTPAYRLRALGGARARTIRSLEEVRSHDT
ncbi:MAG: hypothetical protein ACXVW5_27465 [Solirubrobacteraceae bacterium]